LKLKAGIIADVWGILLSNYGNRLRFCSLAGSIFSNWNYTGSDHPPPAESRAGKEFWRMW